ncbi:MAG: FIST C-terminal domain-containing protein [Phycisphaerae bacterium]|nr:FIST C-terminal domain-containing protein [Phycisphaerae bacterium]
MVENNPEHSLSRTYLLRVSPVAKAQLLLSILTCLVMISGCAVNETYVSSGAQAGGSIVMRVASSQNDDPFEAGKQAALLLREQMGRTAPRTVVLAECFDDKARKKQLLKGVCSLFEKDIVFGFSTYGSFAQEGCFDADSVGLLGIGGEGIGTAAALRRDLGIAGLTMEENEDELAERLRAGGVELAGKLERRTNDRLLVVMADAHSPKNQFLVDGVQEVMGKDFPITGGSANKNAGQTFVYFRGQMYTDSAIALLLSGDFKVSLSGRQAKENAKVISSAAEGAREALTNMEGEPFSVLAFNCAGRKGKLDNIADELEAIQAVMGKNVPLFGAYCAGEIGPADIAEKDPAAGSSGVGWHVMFTVLGR